MVNGTLAKIDAEIATLRERISKLEEAREVIISLDEPILTTGFVKPTVKAKSAPAVETPAPSKKSAVARSFVSAVMGKKMSVKEQIMEIVKTSETPLKSVEIRDRIGPEARKQTVWAAISDMTKNKLLVKNADGTYSLAVAKDS